MIQALITGRLVKDPEVKTGQSGKDYVLSLVAVDAGGDDSILVRVLAFGDTAGSLKRFRKGETIYADGKQEVGIWNSDNGPAVGMTILAKGVAGARQANRALGKGKPNQKRTAQRTMHEEFRKGTIEGQDGEPPWEP
ncbi:single-stranded DNA-binding protein [Qipengyuania aquimaris]|uniref:single-stranded DNA-binding protein n=1 Tax=Qipengyuania aquimaris TaxID=255984 RepID=UPI001C959ACE|nr:single-stranded DNA-binding protein [Qipengyuania aquimaris]MBY6127857.1 single-stranded DNA-binding protein [Qipengyuania aquimaris]